MKNIVLLPLLLLLLLSGCSDSNRYTFSGQGDYWEMTYTVDVQGQTNEQRAGTITYIANDSSPNEVDYRIDDGTGVTEGTNIDVSNGIANIGDGACSGCAVVQGDEEFQVEITWNGQTETFVLTREE